MTKLLYEKESYAIRGAIFAVYKELGSIHKEIVYHRALVEAFKQADIFFEQEKQIAVYFHGKKVGSYVPDFLINNSIIVEIKAKSYTTIEDQRQFWQYLKSTEYCLGFLVNFGKPGGVEIIRRVHYKK